VLAHFYKGSFFFLSIFINAIAALRTGDPTSASGRA
jgi:hypothetical protein